MSMVFKPERMLYGTKVMNINRHNRKLLTLPSATNSGRSLRKLHVILLIFFVLTTRPVKENKSCCGTEIKQIMWMILYCTQRWLGQITTLIYFVVVLQFKGLLCLTDTRWASCVVKVDFPTELLINCCCSVGSYC